MLFIKKGFHCRSCQQGTKAHWSLYYDKTDTVFAWREWLGYEQY